MTDKEAELLATEIEGDILYIPCTNLLYATINQAKKDALAGNRDAIIWFSEWQFEHYCDYLDWNASYIRTEIWLQVVERHKLIVHEEWFREMVARVTIVPI